jgi:hypothetical protein
LSDSHIKAVTKHLGHSLQVHDTYYRTLSNVVEKGPVAKLLILAERGKLGQFAGRTMEDISFEGKL